MSFDDFCYKFYNNVVLSVKAVKAINDEDNQSLIAAVNEPKPGGPHLGDEDSQLTVDNVKEFEQSIHFDEEGLNNFIPESEQQVHKTGEEVKLEAENNEKGKKKGEESERESGGSGDEQEGEEGDEFNKVDVETKPKLTRALIEEIKYMQEQDLFRDILEVKNSVKISTLHMAKSV